MKTKTPAAILVALNKSIISRTKKLAGIFRAVAESGRVDLKLMDDGSLLTPEYVDLAVSHGIGAFIVGAGNVQPAVDRIVKLGLPLATNYNASDRRGKTCSVLTGNGEIARAAANLLLAGRSTASLAYYPAHGDPEWSVARGEAFLSAAAGRRRTAILPRIGMVDALRAMPRPVGVLAANDTYAVELLDGCRKAGLRVPADVAIVGVDNEEFICENASPALTSIEPDFEQEGYEAARAVIKMLEGRPARRSVVCGIRRIALRKSTFDRNYAATLVERAMERIDREATSGLTVADLCAGLRVSRRLLDMRFKDLRKTTPCEAIVERKLAELRKELQNSDDTISAICARCGFGSENHPKKIFRRRYGMTMREFRATKRR